VLLGALPLPPRRGGDAVSPEHQALLESDIPNIEGLANLEPLLGEKGILFVGLPLEIKDGNTRRCGRRPSSSR
jgi:kynurenine formamidase